MSIVTYYKNEGVQFGANGLVASTVSSTLIGGLGLKIRNLTVGQHVVKFVVSVAGEYVTKEFILDVLEGGLTVQGQNGQPDISIAAPLNDVAGIALGSLVFEAIGTAFALAGAELLAFAVVGSVVWTGVVETYQFFTGNINQRFELIDGYNSNGEANVLAGALYEESPTDVVRAVADLLDHAVTEYGYIIGDHMTVNLKGDAFDGLYSQLELTFKIHNNAFMYNVSDAFFDGSVQDFLDYSSGSGTITNGDYYSIPAGVFFVRDGIDRIYLPTEHANHSVTGYHITDIISGSGSITGDADANLIIGSSSSDTLNGGAGVDYLIGGAGDDNFIGRGTSSGLDGDTFIGGSIIYSSTSLNQATRGFSDGDDWVIYSSSSLGVKVDLTNTNQQNQKGYAYAINSSGSQVGNSLHIDNLVSIENIQGSSHNDYLVGSELDNTIIGGDGDDIIAGEAGDDTIVGGYGDDTIDGGAHDVKGDSIDYGILDVNNVIHVNLGSSSVTALDWTGNSSVTISGQTADIFYSTGQLAASDLITNIENIYDTAYSDVIVGDNYDNGFYHSGGNDSYHGGDGDDSFYINGLDQNYTIRVAGGAGDDTLYLGGKASDWETPFNNEGTNITTYVHKASGTKVNAIDFESVSAEGTIYINGSQSAVHKQAGGVFDVNGVPPNGSNGANDPYIDVSRDSANRETTIDISYINENGDLIGITCINFWGGGEEVEDATVYINGIPSVWMNSNGYAFYLPEFGEIDGLKPVEGISDTITSFGNDDLFGSTVLFNDPSTNFYTTTYHGVTASDVMGVYALLDQAESTGSPLILDLDFDGVELVSLANSSIYWDIDQDGFAEHSGWVSADDGLLAIDSNSDGKINSHSELFGSVSGDGFTALSVYDTNSDGVIDVNDEQFGDLLIWRDLNQNGISGAEELFTLADFDIVSIDLNASTPYNMFLEGHNISHVSSYTVDDGVNAAHTHDIVDAWFQYDDMNTLYNQSFDLDLHTLDLPNFRGYGTLPTLQIAMSIDNDLEDADSLLYLVTDMAGRDFLDLFVDDGSVLSDIRDMMLRWAGVDDLDPTSRGSHVDARELVYLETFVGEGYIQSYGGTPNPGSLAAESIERVFEAAILPIAGRILAQAAGAELFLGDIVYDAATDSFSGFTGFNQTTLDALVTKSNDGTQVSDKVEFWKDVLRMVDHSVGVDNISTNDLSVLNTALTASDNSLTVALVLERLQHDIDQLETWTPAGDSLSGTSSADVYSGSVGDDYYNGGYGDDTLNGGFGDDLLYGGTGNDILNGQLGDDYLKGDSGDDTYLFSLGHGNDEIADSGGTDKIVFGEGISLADLTIVRTGSYDLSIMVDPNVGAGSITALNQGLVNGGVINILEFYDSSVFDLNTMDQTYTGDATDETIYGVRVGYGGSGVDTIYGLDGNDIIYGYRSSYSYTAENYLYGGNGDDSIYGDRSNEELYGEAGDDYLKGNKGDDQLTGGLGDDYIKGGSGADTYYFNYGDGNDTYSETQGNATIDTIAFGAGITFNMLSIYRTSTYDVKIDIDGGVGGSILIEDQVKVANDVLELLEFTDGSIVDLNTLNLTYSGTSDADILYGAKVDIGSTGVDTIYGLDGNDTIYGYKTSYSYTAENYLYGGNGDDSIYGDRSDEELYGEAGDDYISGNQGDDLISGGAGADTLIGGAGADTFIYESTSAFSSIDTITDFDASDNDAIDIADLLSGYDPLTDAISDFVQITDNGTDSILSVDADGGADNFIQIATLTGVTGLTDENALETSGNLIAA